MSDSAGADTETDVDVDSDSDSDIDDVDRQILSGLLEDGRAGPSDLAERAGVATSTATKRLQRLEERGVVEGYRPEVDYAAFGYGVEAVFRLHVVGAGIETVVADLQSTGRMVAVYEVTGETDVIAVGTFEDTDEMNAAITDLLTHEYVREVKTNVVLDTVCGYDPPPIPPLSE
jgi:DNA-binding Lrp family transcriptional regulator